MHQRENGDRSIFAKIDLSPFSASQILHPAPVQRRDSRAVNEQIDRTSTVRREQEHALMQFPAMARSLLYFRHRSLWLSF